LIEAVLALVRGDCIIRTQLANVREASRTLGAGAIGESPRGRPHWISKAGGDAHVPCEADRNDARNQSIGGVVPHQPGCRSSSPPPSWGCGGRARPECWVIHSRGYQGSAASRQRWSVRGERSDGRYGSGSGRTLGQSQRRGVRPPL